MILSGITKPVLRFDPSDEIVSREAPVEGCCRGLVVLLEAQQPLFHILHPQEVVRNQDFALNNGEVDFDLVEPARVDRAVNRHTRLGNAWVKR